MILSNCYTPYVSTSCLEHRGYVDTVNAYATAGFDRVELGYCHDCVNVCKWVESLEGDILAHNYFLPRADPFVLNLASPDETILQRSIAYVQDAIEFCSNHGIPSYSIHAGFRVDPTLSLKFTTSTVPPFETSFETFVESLRTVLHDAERNDVSLWIENNVVTAENVHRNSPLLMFSEPGEFSRLFDRIDSNQLGVLLDTGHLKVSSTTLQFDPTEFISEVSDHVEAVHLHTNDGLKDQHEPVTGEDDILMNLDQFLDQPIIIESRFDSLSKLETHIEEVTGLRRSLLK